MAHQPQALRTGPTLGVTPSGVKPLTLKGRAYQLQGPAGEKGSKQAGITQIGRLPGSTHVFLETVPGGPRGEETWLPSQKAGGMG